MNEDNLIEIIPGDLYDIHVKDCSIGLSLGETLMRMESCYTKEGYYIGDIKTADFLTKEKGLTQLQPAKDGDNVCSLGFCERDQKWYGFSHRAIFGFGVGSEVKPGDCAFKPRTVQEWINSVIDWNKDDDVGWGLGRIKSFTWDGPTNTLTLTKHDSNLVTTEKFEPEHLGNGEWRAGDLGNAKRMAIEFAESVSSTPINDFTCLATSVSKPVVFNPYYGARPKVKRIKINLRD